jgi:hypothetical protein
MHPWLWRHAALLGQPDQPDGWPIAEVAALLAPERRLQLPNRRVPRTADMDKRDARSRLTSLAHYLQPIVPTVEAFSDAWRGLRRATEAFHLLRPKQAGCSITLPYGLDRAFCGSLSMHLRRHHAVTEDAMSRLATHAPTLSHLGCFDQSTTVRCCGGTRHKGLVNV